MTANAKRAGSRRAIVVDVDNTVISQDQRKLLIARLILNRPDIKLSDIRENFECKNLLGDNVAAAHEFWRTLFSTSYGEAVEPIPLAKDSLDSLMREFVICYMSARPSASAADAEIQRRRLIDDLQRFGFPLPSGSVELHLPDPGPLPRTAQDFTEMATKFKTRKVQELTLKYDIVAVIGDTSDDMLAAANSDVVGILYKNYFTLQQCSAVECIASAFNLEADDSTEIRRLILRVASSFEDTWSHSLLRKIHIEHYSSYLDDLDFKNYLNLLIATALFAGASNFLLSGEIARRRWWRDDGFGLDLAGGLLVGSAAACLIAIWYAIWGFASRHSRGTLSGSLLVPNLKTRDFIRYALALLVGWERFLSGSPIAAAKCARKGSEQERRHDHLLYFRRRYGSVDPDVVANQLLLDLRAINYAKIYPEYLSRAALLFGGLMFVVAMVLMFWSPALKDQGVRL